MGDYRVLVQIDEPSARMAVPDAHTQANLTVETVQPLRESRGRRETSEDGIDFSALVRTQDASAALKGLGTTRRAMDGDLGDSLSLDSLLPEGATLGGTTGRMVRSQGSTVAQIAPEEPADGDSTMIRSADQRRLARLRDAARARLDGSSSVPILDPRAAFVAFCRGAGIDPAQLPVQDEAQALQLAGRMLRESVLGLKEILRAQQAFQHRHGIEVEAPEGRSPLEVNVDELLIELIIGHQRRQLDAVMRLRDQFRHAGGHAAAIDPALREALQQFLAHLAPDRLASGQDAAANWNRYKDVYVNLIQARDSDLPHLFLEALSLAYKAARNQRDE
jgi:predicted component of type VI protein secretion system